MHAEISGTVDFKEPNDHLCIARLRSLVGRLGHGPRAPFDHAAFDPGRDKPKYPGRAILCAILDSYDMHEVIARLVDRSEFDEYKPDYGKTVICGYGAYRRVCGRHRGQPENPSTRTPARRARSGWSSAA